MRLSFSWLGFRMAIVAITTFCATATDARMDTNIDRGWHFVGGCIDGSTVDTNIDLPHTWNATDASTGYAYYRGIGTYSRSLQIPESDRGKRFFLKFEAAQTVADVSVNGTHVGQHRGGYTAFSFEITDYVNPGSENRIVVEVNNEASDVLIPLSGDFPLFGGLHRSVHLITTDLVCITPLDYASPGVYIRQREVSTASGTVDVTAKVSNGGPTTEAAVEVSIIDASGTEVARSDATVQAASSETTPATVTLTVSSPSLWHGRKSPYLYSVVTRVRIKGLVVDEVIQPLGFRTFRFDKDKGFFLNGEHQKILGVARHQDVKGRGSALVNEDHRRDLEHILDMGANSVRLSHYPHSEFFYDLCDSSGLTVYTEIPWVGSNGPGYNSDEGLKANIRQSMIEMIRQNFNHPSVILWGIQNELHNPDELSPLPYIREMHDLAKQEDPDRPTAAANAMIVNLIGTDVTGWNQYFGWYRGHSPQMGDWLDETHETYPDVAIGITEYGAGGSINHHEENVRRAFPFAHPWHPEAWQAQVHEDNWREISSREYVWGSYLWNMFDFASFFRREGDALGMNDKGMVTYDKQTRKDVFYFYRANWSEEPTVYIANRRYVKREQAETSVKVYANAEEVTLSVNGDAYGPVKGEQGIFLFNDVFLTKGNNVVLAAGVIGGKVHEDRVVWLHDDSGRLDTLIGFFRYGIKPVFGISLLTIFFGFGQGWKAGLAGWKKWAWRGVFVLSALIFVAITIGWIWGGMYRIDIFAFSLI
jgi:beta-galactosidase